MATYKVISLNINEGIRRASQLKFFRDSDADIICLQEASLELTRYFSDELGLSYAYCTTWKKPSGDTGIAVLSKVEQKSHTEIPYWEDKINPEELSRRVMLASTFNINDVVFTVINLHFIWSANGKHSTEQLMAIARVKDLTSSVKDLILVGDFNAPRGGKVFEILSKHLTDNIPQHYTTSIDERIHRKGSISAMVDGLFTHRDSRIKIVRTHFEHSLSDHLALVAIVEVKEGARDEL